ncbi:eukaryotic translation initiation factor 3 subunit i [Phtheirospermum japonicum]|uniref:Eukaryotic translation initiation factor 3 subunit I n=1 Tax=Phtheirospermum japonicum TaxID=374723 RepID=A0A830DIF9_9LAMI|nr:eukaryotic translation initiation factor 3 subunit i [Phtheirospermum japonicum]
MRPILMKGHERPLTFLKYNREGDLLFSCAKDHNPTVWFADNGERLGTYRGHNGAVWSCDISRDSSRLITGSADQSAKIWDVKSGAPLFTFNFDSPTRSVDFAVGDKLAVITTDPFMGHTSAIHIKRIARDPEDQTAESTRILKGPQGRINRAVWGPLNRTVISAGEDTVIRIWDSETGILLNESDKEDGHKKPITSLAKSADGSHFITGSLDKSAKLWDTRTLKLIKTYGTERPVNAVAMSPLLDHVVLGGGQDASSVTTTDHRAGKFEAKFYDKILTEEIGGVKGHFGPINALAFNPDGRRLLQHQDLRMKQLDSGSFALEPLRLAFVQQQLIIRPEPALSIVSQNANSAVSTFQSASNTVQFIAFLKTPQQDTITVNLDVCWMNAPSSPAMRRTWATVSPNAINPNAKSVSNRIFVSAE